MYVLPTVDSQCEMGQKQKLFFFLFTIKNETQKRNMWRSRMSTTTEENKLRQKRRDTTKMGIHLFD